MAATSCPLLPPPCSFVQCSRCELRSHFQRVSLPDGRRTRVRAALSGQSRPPGPLLPPRDRAACPLTKAHCWEGAPALVRHARRPSVPRASGLGTICQRIQGSAQLLPLRIVRQLRLGDTPASGHADGAVLPAVPVQRSGLQCGVGGGGAEARCRSRHHGARGCATADSSTTQHAGACSERKPLVKVHEQQEVVGNH